MENKPNGNSTQQNNAFKMNYVGTESLKWLPINRDVFLPLCCCICHFTMKCTSTQDTEQIYDTNSKVKTIIEGVCVPVSWVTR